MFSYVIIFTFAGMFLLLIIGLITKWLIDSFLTEEKKELFSIPLYYAAFGVWAFASAHYVNIFLKYVQELGGFITLTILWKLAGDITAFFSNNRTISNILSFLGASLYIIAGIESALALYERISRWIKLNK